MMLDGLREIAATGLRIGFHAENNEIMQHLIRKLKAAGRTDPLAHVDSRPALAEVESIQRMGLYAQHTGTKIHIFHLSSRDGPRHDRRVARQGRRRHLRDRRPLRLHEGRGHGPAWASGCG